MRKKYLAWSLIAIFSILAGAALLRVDIERKNRTIEEEVYPNRGLPVIDILLSDVSLDDIKDGLKETKYGGNGVLIYGEGAVYEYGGVEIKGRGNSTWLQPKRPYQIKFEEKVDLFGLGKAKKWVLLANFLDVGAIRNDAAMLLAEMLEEQYNSRGKFVEVYFGGEYEGLYYLMHKMEIDKASVDLRDDKGVLVELDTLHKFTNDCYTSYSGSCLVLKDIVNDDIENTKLAMDDFMKQFNKLEVAVEKHKYEDVAKLIDIESFAKYFLISEFTVNPDAYVSSFYLYKDGAHDKIHAGPVWDFDLALGNRNWTDRTEEIFFSPGESMVRKSEVIEHDGSVKDANVSRLLYYLMEMPEFQEEVNRIFQEKLSGRALEFKKSLFETTNIIRDAVNLNNEKWETGDFDAEIEYLMDWISKRYEFFENAYGDKDNKLRFL